MSGKPYYGLILWADVQGTSSEIFRSVSFSMISCGAKEQPVPGCGSMNIKKTKQNTMINLEVENTFIMKNQLKFTKTGASFSVTQIHQHPEVLVCHGKTFFV